MQDTQPNVLEIAASGRDEGSVSRRLSADLVAALETRHDGINLTRRNLAAGVPLVDADWIDANFTPDEVRTPRHREILAYSDSLVAEVKNADILVIGLPVYNFSVPAALKAWIDMIARARLTFRYTDSGPRGLLQGKKAYLVVATGGVPVGSAADFATPYMKHVLGFIGINDVEVVAADRLNVNADESIDRARARIAELVHLAPAA